MSIPIEWTLINATQITSLWASYGHILRKTYRIDKYNTITTIEKIVSPPTNNEYDESHMRRMLSYQIERYFYKNLAPLLEYTKANIAKVYQCSLDSLEIQDLRIQYPIEYDTLGYNHTKIVLQSLAAFHARFWYYECPLIKPPSLVEGNTDEGIWEEGCYWYLRARKVEYEKLTEPWKRIARVVDDRIQKIPAKFKTVVHGDLKCANMVFSNDEKCAFYDFQYVGGGPGVRDLAKFMVSSVDNVEKHEEEYLAFYFGELKSLLSESGKGKDYSFEIMIEHYELCFVDYYRFLLGGVAWGDVKYAKQKVQQCLRNLKIS